MAAWISLSEAFMPRPAILSMVACHPARSWRREMERSNSWHWAQSFSISALPGPAGSCASAVAARRRLMLNREAERIKSAVIGAEIDLTAAAGEAAAVDEGGDRLAAVPEGRAARAVERVEHRI